MRDPIKYEVDKESGALFVDRFMMTAMHYPANYGYVPQTIAEDDDPVDVLVHTPFPLLPGVVVRCRAVGVLRMEDESGGDAKVLAVPTDDICPLFTYWKSIEDVPEMRLQADPAFLRALQGSRGRQVGAGHRLGRGRGRARGDPGRRGAPRRGQIAANPALSRALPLRAARLAAPPLNRFSTRSRESPPGSDC